MVIFESAAATRLKVSKHANTNQPNHIKLHFNSKGKSRHTLPKSLNLFFQPVEHNLILKTYYENCWSSKIALESSKVAL